jgi:diguanylate cyclase (GGDEF)-like protein
MTQAWPKRTRSLTAVLTALVFGVALSCAAPAAAADRAQWPALASAIFRTVGESAITSTTAIVEDDAGFLWAGGQSGLFRWDGYRLRTYEPDPQVPGSLPDSFINVLNVDRGGRLWIGMTSGGLARYDAARDAFVRYPSGRSGPSSDTVYALAGAGDGLWVGTSAGLDFRVERSGVFRRYRHRTGDSGSLPDNVIHALLLDRHETLWVATDGGLARIEHGSTHFSKVPLPVANGETPTPLSLFEDSSGRIWVGTQRHGLFVLSSGAGAARRVHGNGPRQLQTFLAGDAIKSIGEPQPGEMWLGTYDHGILSLDTATDRLGWTHNEPDLPTSLPQNTVWSMHRDRSGLMWVGTLGGLSRYDARQHTFATILIASRSLGGIASPDVTALYAPLGGPLWVGYGSDGVDLLDPMRGRVGAIRPNPATPKGALPDTATRAIAGSPGGPVFIGSDHGLYAADASGRGVHRIPLVHRAKGDDIGTLCLANGRLWIGTSSDGLWSMDARGRSAPVRVKAQALSDNRILSLLPDADSRLWVGTYHGLDMIDLRSGSAEHIGADAADPHRLANDFISALMLDRRGRVWVGTFGGGIAVMDGRGADGQPRFERISTAQGLPNANIDSLIADRDGHVWVATDNGLAIVDEATLAVRRFGRSDGVELTGYYVGSAATLANGDLVFGANRGVTVVHPDRLRDWTYRPPLVVTDVRTGGHAIAADAFNIPGSRETLVVRPQANSFAVEFSALDFSAPEQNRYQYRLDGFDTAWIDTDASRRLAAYTNLPPGDFVLELRGSNRTGAWSPAQVAIPVRVEPAWHQTLAVHVAEVLLALLVVAGLVQARTAVTRRHERELERLVAQRTAELERTTGELRNRETQLHLMAYRDALTDLPNRRMFTDDCRRMLAAARRAGSEFALLLIDLDRFKHVNDTLGHGAGDVLLVEAATRLAKLVRDSDCVARLGGDEFVILLGGAQDISVEGVCERIVAAFEAPVTIGDATLRTTPSIGVAMFPKHGNTPDQLYKSADIALYAAKLAGRNTWRCADAESV